MCVYCGSSTGTGEVYLAAAKELGRTIANRGTRLVYGGGHVGLMGAVADAALEQGGDVLGVITRALEDKEIAHRGLTELRVVGTMHERKAAMSDAADAFVMLPGGYGTWDEFFEALTWTQLGVHLKPCGILDVSGYFGPLLSLMDAAVQKGFVRQGHRDLVLYDTGAPQLLDRLARWEPVALEKWADRSQRQRTSTCRTVRK